MKTNNSHLFEKLKVYEPTSIEDAINCLQDFLESDLEHAFSEEFKSEEDLWAYLTLHFNILRKEVKKIQKKKVKK